MFLFQAERPFGLSPPPPPSRPMKTSLELAVSGIQALQLRRKGRGSYRVKSRASYVDETLFGRPAGSRPPPPEFDPPWAEEARTGQGGGRAPVVDGSGWKLEATPSRGSSPSCTPRKKNKYRLIAHTPSYCDETLFGRRPEGPGWEAPWMTKGEAAKLRPLLWTPPSAPQGSPAPHPKETPVRAVHPVETPGAGRAGKAKSGERPGGGPACPSPSRRGLAHSPTRLNTPAHPPSPRGQQDPHARPAAVTFRSPLVTPRLRSVCNSEFTTSRHPPNPKPPWK
ncbi:RBPJ-interacting and tubulin-associated protein 1 [Tachyglossus aculeatus]|uniref:RBPJ-interacting and tubulin-associated protein 1 n=1 Tax=Tachyglossus aculeatus TaxID=9261 RepID=UPI0018F5602F|nr:RBPJ-interacting and tubulin-associated protein 1 [Tachyglossus aculeatus]